jgi:Terminase large subunit, T4likevirus-type, N-terminal
MARTRLPNREKLVEFKFNPYQEAYLEARRRRVCPNVCVDAEGNKLIWSMLESLVCPRCKGPGIRAFRRFYLRAGRRGGKTRVGALSAIEECTVPNSIGWACAPSFDELDEYVLRAFFSILPQEWYDHPLTEWSESRRDLTLPNGAQVQFRSLDDPNRATGPGLDWLWIDEGRKIQELAWNIARPTLIDRKGIAFVTSSPDWGKDWCHRHFWQPAAEGKPGYWAVQYRTVDNPVIDKDEVERDRATMPPELFRREYEASVESPTGTIYGAVLEPCVASDDRIREWIPEWPRIDPSRPTICGLDPGTDHPFAAALLVITPAGIVWAGEYCEREKIFMHHAALIKQMVAGFGHISPRYGIDRSAAQASLELSQYGIYPSPAENNQEAGIQRVYAWMASNRFRIAESRVVKGLEQMRGYRWADIKPTLHGNPTDAKPYKVDDDLPDGLRYGIMLWPELPQPAAVLAPGVRDLAALPAEQRRLIERNLVKDEDEDARQGLVRVTDSYEVDHDDYGPGAEHMADFYQ